MTTPSTPGNSIGGQSVFWGVSEGTVKRGRVEGVPYHSVEEMAVYAQGRPVPKAVRKRLKASRRPTTAALPVDNPDWIEFEKQARTDDPKESMAKIAKARDFAAFMFEKAGREPPSQEAQDRLKFYSDLLARMESCLHDALLRGRKLGIDTGELIPKVEVERLVFAMAWWLMRCVDDSLDAMCAKLSALSPGMEPKAVRNLIEPFLMSAMILEPLARADIACGVQIPTWLSQKMRTTAGDYLENGEAMFDQLRGTPAAV
jgi:hypothetical protein